MSNLDPVEQQVLELRAKKPNLITCPKCGTDNPLGSMNCSNCKVNLNFVISNPSVLNPEPSPVQAIESTKKGQSVSAYIGYFIFGFLIFFTGMIAGLFPTVISNSLSPLSSIIILLWFYSCLIYVAVGRYHSLNFSRLLIAPLLFFIPFVGQYMFFYYLGKGFQKVISKNAYT